MSPWLSDLYLRSQSDARLLSLARDGHGRAFAVLAERYRSELLGQARRLSAAGNAEDLVQQTLLSAFAALRRGAEVGHARGWLHAILRHAAIRARAPIDAPLDAAVDALVAHDTLLDTRADARELLSALDELPARQREALVGSAMHGLSRAELAASLGVSEGAVRQLVHRARTAVRAAVTAATPYQLARWLSHTAPARAGAPEIALSGGAGAGALLAKLGMVAAAGAIAAGGAAVAEHHGARPHGPRRGTLTVAADADPALRRAARPTGARAVAETDVDRAGPAGTTGAAGRGGDARGRSGTGGRDAGRLASGSGSSGTGASGAGASGSRDGGGDRTAGQTGAADGASGSAPQPPGSPGGSPGSGGDTTSAAVPASAGGAPAMTGTGGDGTGVVTLGTGGVDGPGGPDRSDGSGGASAPTTPAGSSGSSAPPTNSASGDGGETSTN